MAIPLPVQSTGPGGRIRAGRARNFHTARHVFRPPHAALPVSLGVMGRTSHSLGWLESPLGSAVLGCRARRAAGRAGRCIRLRAAADRRWGGSQLALAARTQHRRCIASACVGPRRDSCRLSTRCRSRRARSRRCCCRTRSSTRRVRTTCCARSIACCVGEGHLVICGFNPWSPWGLRHLVGARPVSAARRPAAERSSACATGCSLLGFEIVGTRRYLFAPPWHAGLRPVAAPSWLEHRGPQYRAAARGRVPAEGAQTRARGHADPARSGSSGRDSSAALAEADVEIRGVSDVEIYTDGACRGNPGPGRLGRAAGLGRAPARALRRRGAHHQQPHGADRGDRARWRR